MATSGSDRWPGPSAPRHTRDEEDENRDTQRIRPAAKAASVAAAAISRLCVRIMFLTLSRKCCWIRRHARSIGDLLPRAPIARSARGCEQMPRNPIGSRSLLPPRHRSSPGTLSQAARCDCSSRPASASSSPMTKATMSSKRSLHCFAGFMFGPPAKDREASPWRVRAAAGPPVRRFPGKRRRSNTCARRDSRGRWLRGNSGGVSGWPRAIARMEPRPASVPAGRPPAAPSVFVCGESRRISDGATCISQARTRAGSRTVDALAMDFRKTACMMSSASWWFWVLARQTANTAGA